MTWIMALLVFFCGFIFGVVVISIFAVVAKADRWCETREKKTMRTILFIALLFMAGCGSLVEIKAPAKHDTVCPENTTAIPVPPEYLPPNSPYTIICLPTTT